MISVTDVRMSTAPQYSILQSLDTPRQGPLKDFFRVVVTEIQPICRSKAALYYSLYIVIGFINDP